MLFLILGLHGEENTFLDHGTILVYKVGLCPEGDRAARKMPHLGMHFEESVLH